MLKTSKKIHWWIFALVAFFIFVLLQVPAAWLIAKFYKNNQVLHNVSGNIWQGQADWKQGNLSGSIHWQSRPLDLLRLRLGSDIDIHSGNTALTATVGYGLAKTFYLQNLQGQISPETLQQFAAWQWPNNAIRVQALDLQYQPNKGFSDVDGNVQWTGGDLIYTFAQRQERINVPQLLAKARDEQQKLLLDVQDNREQKMLNLSIDADWMLDLQITQRFLMNAPGYQGQAGLDTYVISTRQPLIKGGW
jgi:general secretion pathway protein N